VLLAAWTAQAQPILRNAITTNALAHGTGALTNDGSGGFGWTLLTGNVTNVYNSVTITNLTVINTNVFNVSKGGHLTVSNSLSILTILTNVLATTGTGLVTNMVVGSGLAYDTSTRTLSATASGGGVTTDVTTLGWSGTNITGFDATTNGMSFYLLATNNAHFGTATFSNLPAKTAYKTYTLCVQMDSTGGRIITFTNTVVGWALAQPVFIETNASAVSYVYLHTDLTTNSTLVGTANVDVRR